MAGPLCTYKTRVLVSVQDSSCVFNCPLYVVIHTAGYCTLPHQEKPLVLYPKPSFGLVRGKALKNPSD